MFSNDLIEAAYDASKAINHSVFLYNEDIFSPMLSQMITMNSKA